MSYASSERQAEIDSCCTIRLDNKLSCVNCKYYERCVKEGFKAKKRYNMKKLWGD